MKSSGGEIIVAGHVCLDIIPKFPDARFAGEELLRPGKLTVVGPATIATGGSVSNTGIALNRLGVPTVLMGKVGDDLYGKAVLDILRSYGDEFVSGMSVVKGETTSYSIVISPPGVDRMFLHCPGANDTFGKGDVDLSGLESVKLFHLGYPPIMRRMFIDGGKELESIFRLARERGMTTSLDMSMPDPASESGRVDWKSLLELVLPRVDVFLPSFEEVLFMLNRPLFDDLMSGRAARERALENGEILNRLASDLIAMGAAIVGIKLGEDGFYLQTSGSSDRIGELGKCTPGDVEEWTGRELLAPCFKVDVAGTTGAGDSTISGFLAGMVKGLDPEEAMISAVAVGAFNVEKADATSGIPSWKVLQDRILAGWQMRPVCFGLSGWVKENAGRVWHGPRDGSRNVD